VKPFEPPAMFSVNVKSRSNPSISVNVNNEDHENVFGVSDDEQVQTKWLVKTWLQKLQKQIMHL
jgi:hypothetical protein